MGDLSWNPTSWTPSNLAEEAVEFISGSEAAGDVAGLAAAWLTGDMLGVAGQAGDLGTNVLAGGSKLLEGFGKAAQDAFQVFSNPGAVATPSQSGCTCTGYADGETTSNTDTGTIGGSTPSSTGNVDGDINSILQGGGSLEDKIFAVLMLLQKEKKDQVEKKIGNLGNTQDKEKNLQELQKSTGELSQLTQLTTGLMNNFKQMKDSVIQNIR